MLSSIDDPAPPRSPARVLSVAAALLLVALMFPVRSLAADTTQRVFPTPNAAVDALIAAAKEDHPKAALVPILGPDAERVLSSGDPVADDNARKNFVRKYDEMHRLAYDPDGHVILYVGAENWPLPIPLIKKDHGWLFDTAAGEKELAYRRIGANELYTIDVLQNLVEAQNEFASRARQESGAIVYAQKILSDQGQHNGLYWPTQPGEPESPIGPLIAKAAAEGYKRSKEGQPIPFHGYVYRVLTGQGKDAPGGAMSYMHDGRMTGGFAFLAYPVSYRSSGVMTFMVGQDGIVLQKDLGTDTKTRAREITSYDPAKSWQPAAPEDIQPEQTEESQAEPGHAAPADSQ